MPFRSPRSFFAVAVHGLGLGGETYAAGSKIGVSEDPPCTTKTVFLPESQK